MTIVIYFDESKKNFQIVRPTKDFDGNVRKLVEHITHSNHADGEQNYWKFEIK
jgi:hypothetical protein